MRNVKSFEDFVEESKAGATGATGSTAAAPAMTDDDAVEETVVMKPGPAKFDVTTSSKSIAGKLEAFIAVMGTLSFEAIREKFLSVVNDPDTHASDATRAKWVEAARKATNKVGMMRTITNLYLAGANLKVD